MRRREVHFEPVSGSIQICLGVAADGYERWLHSLHGEERRCAMLWWAWRSTARRGSCGVMRGGLVTWRSVARLGVKGVQTRTMTIYTEAKISSKMARNGLRMHLPRAYNTFVGFRM